MIVPDINLLLYAYNHGASDHRAAAKWWADCLGGTEVIGMAPPVLLGFVRLATNRHAFQHPMTISLARRFVTEWLKRPYTRLLEVDSLIIQHTLELLEGCGTGGNLVSDAEIAALAVRHNGVVHTADADFARFPGVRWRNPIRGTAGR